MATGTTREQNPEERWERGKRLESNGYRRSLGNGLRVPPRSSTVGLLSVYVKQNSPNLFDLDIIGTLPDKETDSRCLWVVGYSWSSPVLGPQTDEPKFSSETVNDRYTETLSMNGKNTKSKE